jgi:cytochrome b
VTNKVRVWDLPTRLFHWALVLCVTGLLVTGTVGGNAMVWHFRLGYAALTLLMFRLIWGLIGGRWSRFSSFLHSPSRALAYLKGRGDPQLGVGHSPLGAGSVFAMLLVLAAQVASGLASDDEIAFAGPLTKFVSSANVSLATYYHKNVGRWILIALVVLHIAAVLYYLWVKRRNLIKPMLTGDKDAPPQTPVSRDDWASRLGGVAVLASCAAVVAWGVARFS